MQANYDYIFTGAGCAGLSLIMRLIKSGHLNSKKVLIIDKSAKTANDRTWCFWEKKSGFFESLVHHSWGNLSIYGSLDEKTNHEASTSEGTNSEEIKNERIKNQRTKNEGTQDEGTKKERTNHEEIKNEEIKNAITKNQRTKNNGSNYAETFAISPYRYKMIRGIDFYDHCLNQIKANENITILYDEVLETGNTNGSAFAKTTSGTYTATYVFNSIPSKELLQRMSANSFDSILTKSLNDPITTQSLKHSTHHSPLTTHHFSSFLLQHFKGFLIRSPNPEFDPDTATLMDFRVRQQHGTSFVYVLPISKYEALVEYTLFTAQLLSQETYDQVVFKYIKQILKIDSYDVVATEFGVIPMTDLPFSANSGRVINIGTAGGQTKPSTGYTFVFIQKQADAIASLLATGKFPVPKNSFTTKKFHWYDSILLRVLANGKLPGAFIFTELFRKNRPTDVFRFLDNESNIFQDLKVIKALPTFIFAGAAIRQATKPPGSPVLHT